MRTTKKPVPGYKGSWEKVEGGELPQLLLIGVQGEKLEKERERVGSVLIKLEGPIQTFYTDRDAGFTCLGWGECSLAS